MEHFETKGRNQWKIDAEEYQVSKFDLLQACVTPEPYSSNRNVHLSLKNVTPCYAS